MSQAQHRIMPPEWSPHAATWMGFPRGAYPEAAVTDEDTWDAWSSVANAIVDFEPVHMLCHPDDIPGAERRLSGAIETHVIELDDAWLRDIGPTFVVANDRLLAIDWQFNGWGNHTSFDFHHDALVGQAIAGLTDTPPETSALVNEGGAFHVNGQGCVLLTDTVQMDPDRNPDWSRDDIEAEIHSRLGTDRAIWLPRGLHRDYLDHGTRGHIDMVACFTPDGRILLHQQLDQAHPDASLHSPMRALLENQGFEVVSLPAPVTTRDGIDWVDYSYINHYVLNSAVIYPSFADANDDRARELLSDCYPGRDIVAVDGRVLFAMGGGVHCITQQQPALTANE